MKRFFAKIILFLLILAVLTGVINYAYMKLDTADTDNTKKYKNIPASVQVCNFGSSHGLCGFDYQDVEGTACFNFALESQSLSYDKRLFDHYLENIGEDAIVFLPVSYQSFFGKDERKRVDFAEMNKRYYKILPAEMIKDYDIKTDFYVSYFPSLVAGENLINVILGRSRDINAQTWMNETTPEDAKRFASGAYERHIIRNKFDEKGNRIINQEEVDALNYMVETCYEKGFTPVLVTTPYLQEYTDEIKKNDPEFYNVFYEMMDTIVDETGAAYYDYAFDERFRNHYEWFMDSDHLNQEGARNFVRILMDEVVHEQ